MKGLGFFLLLLGTSVAVAAPDGAMVRAAKSLLTVQQFPKTFDDLSFSSRMQVLAEGFSAMESVYDENGVCVSGCAYYGITIEEEEKIVNQNTQDFLEALRQEQELSGEIVWGSGDDNEPTRENRQNEGSVPVNAQALLSPSEGASAPVVTSSAPKPPVVSVSPTQSSTPSASVASAPKPPVVSVSPTQSSTPPASVASAGSGGFTSPVPVVGTGARCAAAIPGFISPLERTLMVVSDFGWRDVVKGSEYHRGIDLRAASGTPVIAPANGKVVAVAYEPNGAGYYLDIEHTLPGTKHKVKTRFFHLKKGSYKVKKGDVVNQGQYIADSGNSGASGGAHLHYAIYYNNVHIDPLGGYVDPVMNSRYEYDYRISKGRNFLSKEYCFVKGITTKRLKANGTFKDSARIRGEFPCSTGWCEN